MSSDITYQTAMPSFPALMQDTECDVLVIGGGLCGLLCARFLQNAGVDVLVCEAGRIAAATTARSTAVITVGQDVLCRDIAKRRGESAAMNVMRARANALGLYRMLIKKLGCKYSECDHYLYTTEKASVLVHEHELLKSLGIGSELVSDMPLNIKMNAAIRFTKQLQLDPLDFTARLAKGLNICEHTRVTHLTERGAAARSGHGEYSISARHTIIATHFPFPKLRGLYALKLYQQRSYVLALEGVPDIGGTYEDIAEGGVYMRMYEKYLLLGGGDHRTGKSGGGFDAIMKYSGECFPAGRLVTSWATQDTVSLDGLPYIGRLTRNDARVYAATGFGGNGFIGSMLSAELIGDLILGRENNTTSLFDPSRCMLSAQLFENIAVSLGNYLIPRARRCTHLGCALRWNADEHTWDCPCHGSRFAEAGQLINGPAQEDIKR